MATILIVEDDADINHLLVKILKKAGYGTCSAYSGTEALLWLERSVPELLILDLMLPGMSGEELIRYIREHFGWEVPILVLSAKQALADKIGTMTDGADDYLTKPFEPEEVLLHVMSLLRRAQAAGRQSAEGGTALRPGQEAVADGAVLRLGQEAVAGGAALRPGQQTVAGSTEQWPGQQTVAGGAGRWPGQQSGVGGTAEWPGQHAVAGNAALLGPGQQIEAGGTRLLHCKNLILDPVAREVTVCGCQLSLTPHEFEILQLLMEHPGKVFSRESLYEQVWQGGYYGEDNTVNVHVSNLRRKIAAKDPGQEYIKTVWGIGFKLAEKR